MANRNRKYMKLQNGKGILLANKHRREEMNEECLLVHNAFILQLQDIVSEAAAIRENKKEKNDG